jgi:NAD(P)-dependent dehydrogenase (short-subunit alcohol dehydrogenase family)
VTDAVSAGTDALFRLDGKSALIVGGYGGIGKITCELFARHGAAVAIAGRSAEKAKALAGQLTASGFKATGLRVDVKDKASVEACVAAAVRELGGLDIVVNLSSINNEGKAEDLGAAEWQETIDINLTGAFFLSQAAAKVMIPAGKGGRIIHYSSTRSEAGSARRGFAAYGASKAGLNLLIKQMGTEWARHKITVNGVAPGFVATELTHDGAMDPKFMNMMLARIPFGRLGEPMEMAGPTLFLASPAASFITGQILFVDGGVLASS